MAESFVFDPRVFIHKPYSDCPHCGAQGQYGVLSIGPRRCVQRCKSCMQDSGFDLPELDKRIVYLDQHVISKLAKSIHPESREKFIELRAETQFGFWRQAFAKRGRNVFPLGKAGELEPLASEAAMDQRLGRPTRRPRQCHSLSRQSLGLRRPLALDKGNQLVEVAGAREQPSADLRARERRRPHISDPRREIRK